MTVPYLESTKHTTFLCKRYCNGIRRNKHFIVMIKCKKNFWRTDVISTWKPSPFTSEDFAFWWGCYVFKVIWNFTPCDYTFERSRIQSKVIILYLEALYKSFSSRLASFWSLKSYSTPISLNSVHGLAFNCGALETWAKKLLGNMTFNIMAISLTIAQHISLTQINFFNDQRQIQKPYYM